MNKKYPWYKILRRIFQVLYISAIVFSLLGRNMILAMALVAAALFSGAWFCGWLCPFGSIQELLAITGKKMMGRSLNVPDRIDRYLRFSRYLLMAASFAGLGFSLFLSSPYMTFQAVLARNMTYISASWLIYLALVLILSLFIERPFCRYMCTEGARYGLFSLLRVFSIRRNEAACISCRKCDKNCPVQINISVQKHVRNAQCLNCFECIAACPVEGALDFGLALPARKKKTKNEGI